MSVMLKKPIKVLVVEDSPTARELLVHIINSDPDLTVVGTASNGNEVPDLLNSKNPDVITMDINMPTMNGLQITRMVMETDPHPIVVVSASYDPHDVRFTFQAVEAGAVAVLAKPVGLHHPQFDQQVKELTDTIKLMSEVKVIRRTSPSKVSFSSLSPPASQTATKNQHQIVAVGASTGGPAAIQQILSPLPEAFPLPILVVQHISQGFVAGFIEWLSQCCTVKVQIAKPHESLKPGYVYVAPDDKHLGVTSGRRIEISDAQPVRGNKPSVSYLFESVYRQYNSNAVAILLSGMGSDGAMELKKLRDAGAHTIAQNRETSIVYGMPGEAEKLGGVQQFLSPIEICKFLTSQYM